MNKATQAIPSRSEADEERPVSNEEIPSGKRILYISWAASCSRSDHTARELGGVSRMVYLPWLGSHPLTIGFKYVGQTLITFWYLLRDRPDAVFVMSPPLFAALPALLWKFLFRVPFILDCHTGAFNNPRWRRFQRLQRYLCRRAAASIVTNDHLKTLVETWGGTAIIVGDVPVVYEAEDEYPMPAGFNIVAVCSFNWDEPIAEMFKAARQTSELQFFFTGNPKHLPSNIASQRPDNVKLTGFLSDQQFGSLVSKADVVLTLTTEDHTMLRGAWEAIYQATPVIVSDWGILKESFAIGAIHIDNSSESIVNAIRFAQQNIEDLRMQAEQARIERLERWQDVKQSLIKQLG